MRTLSSALEASSTAPVVRGIYLVRIEFDSRTVCWHSGVTDMDFDGYTYKATGQLGNISAASEQSGVQSTSITVTIGGINPAIVELVMAEPYLNRPVKVHYAVLDEELKFSEDRCVMLFPGKITNLTGKQGKTASFALTVSSRLADWERVRKLVYNDAMQQKLHPGDRGMEYIAQLSQKKIIWPRAQFVPRSV